jgi:hypothetical protein
MAGAIERNIAKRAAQRGSAAVLSSAERAALAKVWKDLDAKTLRSIERRYGVHIIEERLISAKNTPRRIVDRATFERQLREVKPSLSEESRQSILGYYYDQRIEINGNHVQLPLTMAHERLHQLAHPRFSSTLGSGFDEGVTESFAREIFSDMGLRDAPAIYVAERRAVDMLMARVGEEPLARAYFRGEMNALRNRLDADLGEGTFLKLSRALRENDLATAEALLR